MRVKSVCLAAWIWVVLVLGTGASPMAQQSASYRLDRLTLAGSAGVAASASFTAEATLAQEGPAGSVSRCNNSFLQSTGFWSVLGETPAPVFLLLDHNALDPAQIDMTWSGSASQFGLYRGTPASDVADPVNLQLTTSQCQAADIPPVSPDILFYLVLPSGI